MGTEKESPRHDAGQADSRKLPAQGHPRSRRVVAAAAIAVGVLVLALLVGFMTRERRASRSARDPSSTHRDADVAVHSGESDRENGLAPQARDVVARDLGDGRPVPGIRIRVARASDRQATSVVVADENGRAEIVAGPSDTVSIDDGTWLLPRYSTAEILSSGEIWVYQMMTVQGDVQPEAEEHEFDPSTVCLSAVTVGLDGYGVPGNESPEPWRPTWLRGHGLDEHSGLPSPASDRSFSVGIPCIQGVVLRAAAPGWRNAFAALPTNAGRGPVYVCLRLQPGFVIGGKVSSEDGTPLKGARVDVYVSKRTDFSGLNREKLKAEAHDGYSASWEARRNSARVTYLSCADTDDGGAFSAEVKSDGDILIVVHARGFVPVRSALGWVGASREGEALVAHRAGAADQLLVSYGGKPLPRHTVMVADLSVGDLQPAFELETDDTGALPTDWLEVGRRYYVLVTGPAVPAKEVVAGTLTWAGQKGLDMRQLAAQFREEEAKPSK